MVWAGGGRAFFSQDPLVQKDKKSNYGPHLSKQQFNFIILIYLGDKEKILHFIIHEEPKALFDKSNR